ncbi:MAG: hypothetical protein ACI9G1_002700 [Pirellulaceae bacterium]
MRTIPITEQGLHVMTKPIGPICNLDCEYCYYLHKEDLYGDRESWRMSEQTLESYIQQYLDAQPTNIPEVTFAWQGGEPTLLGVDFFQRAVELQRKHAGTRKIINTIQTNGVLLNDSWCEFLKANDFLVGISIDGPADLHDRYRYDKQGRPTFPKVLEGLKLLKKHAVEFNVLVVVNRHNGDHGRRVYTYLRDTGVDFMQFIPIVEKRGVGVHAELPLASDRPQRFAHDDKVSSRSVGPGQYGQFLIEVFDEWLRRDVGKVFVQQFEEALTAWMGYESGICIFRKQCGRALAMEHNGDVYSCDHFVEPAYKLGNIYELPIVDMAGSDQQVKFGTDKETTLPKYCQQCEVRFICNGECPKNRFIQTPAGEDGLNYLCESYKEFFNYIDPVMKRMATTVKNGGLAAQVMREVNDERRGNRAMDLAKNSEEAGQSVQRTPARNDPCPCGSGKKFKRCCLRS